jgi:hypothetical protein
MRRITPTLLILAGALLLASGAQARTEVLRWQHANPSEVAHFTVHVGSSSGSYSQNLNVGVPAQQGGAFVYDLTVADSADAYVAISAKGTNGLTSSLSNERLRAAPATPPPPAPLGTPGKPMVVSP